MSNINEWFVLASVIAAIISPIVALLGVVLGYVLHSKHELRRRAIEKREDVFATLMAYDSEHPEYVKALNLIPVVFKDNMEVVKAARDARKFFMEGGASNKKEARVKMVFLLLTMARALGYKDMDETDVTVIFARRVE